MLYWLLDCCHYNKLSLINLPTVLSIETFSLCIKKNICQFKHILLSKNMTIGSDTSFSTQNIFSQLSVWKFLTSPATKSKIFFLSVSKGLHKSKKWISSSICLIYGYPHIHTHFRMTVDLYVEVLIYCHWLRQISLKTIHTCILAEMNLHFPNI